MKAGLIHQFQEAVHSGARQLVRLPHPIAGCLPHEQSLRSGPAKLRISIREVLTCLIFPWCFTSRSR